MKAAVVHEFGKPPVIEDVDVPEVGAGQILVRIAASGVCHTDIHAAEGDWPVKPPLPFIPGHEGVEYAAKAGAGVKILNENARMPTEPARRARQVPAAAENRRRQPLLHAVPKAVFADLVVQRRLGDGQRLGGASQ